VRDAFDTSVRGSAPSIHPTSWKWNSRKFTVANFRSLPRPGTYRDAGEPTFSPQPHPDATCIARIRYKLLRLATISTSENFSYEYFLSGTSANRPYSITYAIPVLRPSYGVRKGPDARSKMSGAARSDALLRHRERKTPSGRRQRSEVML